MIEATIVFKEGIQTHLTINVSFEDIGDEIETKDKIGFIEFIDFHERIPSYLHVLGKLLKKRAVSFWEGLEEENNKCPDIKFWFPEAAKGSYKEKDK